MTTLSDRVEGAVTKIENSSDIAEKFADVSRTVEFDTPKGPVKPIGQLQQEADAAIARIAHFTEETWVAGQTYTEKKIYFIHNGIAYNPVVIPYTAGSTDIQADIDAGLFTVLQGLTAEDMGPAAFKVMGKRGGDVPDAADTIVTFESLLPVSDGGQFDNAVEASLKLGQRVKVLGRKHSNDSGGGEFLVVDEGVDDNGSVVSKLDGSGFKLKRIREHHVDAAAFGLVYGGIIDHVRYNNFINYCRVNNVKAVISGKFSDVGETKLSIPSNFPTLQEALDFVRFLMRYKTDELIINIEKDHLLTNGCTLIGGDYSNVKITSDDDLVSVSDAYPDGEDLFRGENCGMPKLSCLVDMRDKGGDGYAVRDGSVGFVDQYCGVINAGSRGLYANAGRVFALRSVFDGANNRGCWATRNSFMHVELASFNNCCKTAAEVSAMTSRRDSHIHAQSASIKHSFTGGVSCIRTSTINMEGADVSGCKNGDGISVANGSAVNARFAVINDSQGTGVDVSDASTISLLQATISNSGETNVVVREASRASLRLASVSLGANGVFADAASLVTITEANITNSSGYGLLVSDGAVVNCSNAIISGNATYGIRGISGKVSGDSNTQIINNGLTGVLASNGSSFSLVGSTINGHPAGLDLRIIKGSFVALNDAITSNGSPSIDDVYGFTSFNLMTSDGVVFA